MGCDKIICVTLGKRGIVALIDGRQHTDSGRAVTAVDSTGAGDCFVGAVAALLADGQPIQSAFGYANIAASICVERMGAAPSMPTVQEVSAILRKQRSPKT
jgi:ribokinase